MVQSGRSSRLLFKTLQTIRTGGEKRGKYFDRHVAAQAQVPRPIDLTHASGTDRSLDFVIAEFRPCGQAWRTGTLIRRLELIWRLIFYFEQALYFSPQGEVIRASAIKIRRAFGGLRFQGGGQHVLDLLPALGSQACSSLRLISRSSHSLAVAHSRFTVAGDISSASEVSSIERPAKKRSSTSRD
jgi:hypothetical protein